MSIKELYNKAIKSLPPIERYELARLILSDLPPEILSDYSDSWTEEDCRDLAADSLQNFDIEYPEKEELV